MLASVNVSLIAVLAILLTAPVCIRASSCSVELDGHTYDLSSLSTKTNYYVDDATDPANWEYMMNFCQPVQTTVTVCEGMAVCKMQKIHLSTYSPLGRYDNYVVAKPDNTPFKPKKAVFQITYLKGVDPNGVRRDSTMYFVCGSTDNFVMKGMEDTGMYSIYYFAITTPAACNASHHTNIIVAVASFIGLGWVLLVLMALGVFIYLAVGMVYKRLALGATGLEIIPNIDFWSRVPGLMIDGCKFITWPVTWVVSLVIKHGGGGGQGYSAIDDNDGAMPEI
ncbi:Autophagy-related protein 27 [Carpediemonas membranifera]|uniref:Autophagy-related protein 27 n=1 Tax=Carpediemonas membranifera TaxID=201153 RepID=A0A8J6EAZ7_9EUKA|nr:Autophagy-related protein 27 [Carpediemonas membranifera]|eukprot:KAG9395815.1 Autophagy-related protein 27 [Carpediemonas membranifera]